VGRRGVGQVGERGTGLDGFGTHFGVSVYIYSWPQDLNRTAQMRCQTRLFSHKFSPRK
jgi:hypothetical protein